MTNTYKEIRNKLILSGVNTGVIYINRGQVQAVEPVNSEYNEKSCNIKAFGNVMLYCYDRDMKLLNVIPARYFNS